MSNDQIEFTDDALRVAIRNHEYRLLVQQFALYIATREEFGMEPEDPATMFADFLARRADSLKRRLQNPES